jgi:hypothetical protein
MNAKQFPRETAGRDRTILALDLMRGFEFPVGGFRESCRRPGVGPPWVNGSYRELT